MRLLLTPTIRSAAAVAAISLGAIAACGDDDGDGGAAPADPEAPEAAQAESGSDGGGGGGGGGTATLTIGDEVWEFEGVLCAIGSDQTDSEDWDFVLSATQDGLQLTVDRGAEGGQYGDVIELDDIEDFENPSVSWSAPPIATQVLGEAEPFVDVVGKEVSAEVDFTDNTLEDPTAAGTPGELTATCP